MAKAQASRGAAADFGLRSPKVAVCPPHKPIPLPWQHNAGDTNGCSVSFALLLWQSQYYTGVKFADDWQTPEPPKGGKRE